MKNHLSKKLSLLLCGTLLSTSIMNSGFVCANPILKAYLGASPDDKGIICKSTSRFEHWTVSFAICSNRKLFNLYDFLCLKYHFEAYLHDFNGETCNGGNIFSKLNCMLCTIKGNPEMYSNPEFNELSCNIEYLLENFIPDGPKEELNKCVESFIRWIRNFERRVYK